MTPKKTIKNIRLNYFKTLLCWRIRLRWKKILLIIIFVFSSFLVFAHLSLAQTAGPGIEEACVAGNCCCVTENICFISDGKDCTGKIQVKACSELSDCAGKIIANKDEKPVIFTPQIKIPGLSDVMAVGSGTIASYVGAFYKWSVVAIAILAVIMIMISGINWIFAAGNPTAIKSAQDRFTAALIGLVLVLICIPLLSLINPALVKLSTLEIPIIEEVILGKCTDPNPKNTTACELRGGCPKGQYCGGEELSGGIFSCACGDTPPQSPCTGEGTSHEDCLKRKPKFVYKKIKPFPGKDSYDYPINYQPCVLDGGTCGNKSVPCDSNISPSLVPCHQRQPVYWERGQYSCVAGPAGACTTKQVGCNAAGEMVPCYFRQVYFGNNCCAFQITPRETQYCVSLGPGVGCKCIKEVFPGP